MEKFRKAFPGRAEMIDYYRKHNIDVEASASKLIQWIVIYSTSLTKRDS